MLNRRSLLAAVPALALVSPAALATQDGPSKLAEAMGNLNRGLRKLRKATESEESLAAAVETVCSLQQAVLDAKGEVPPLAAAEEDATKKAAMILDFRKQLQGVIVHLFDAENAALSGDKEGFKKAMGELNAAKKKGHDAHMPQW